MNSTIDTSNPSVEQLDFRATNRTQQRARLETIGKILTFATALALVIPVLSIIAYIFFEASPVLSWNYIWDNPSDGSRAGGVWSPLIGTFYLVLVSLLIVAPVGILAGIYLNEYASDNWFTRIVNMAVTSLAGVPSIVHALFGVGAFVLFFKMGPSLLAASCTVAVMTVPVIITATREAMAAVPQSFREACWNMGASKWQTIRTIVLPNSISGILTGVILEIARAAGETAPILFTGAVYFSDVADSGFDKFMPYYLGDKFMALSMHLHVISTQITDMPVKMQFGCAAVIVGLIFVVNSVAIALRVYLRSVKRW